MASLAAMSAIRLRKINTSSSSSSSSSSAPSQPGHQVELRELRALLETTRSQLAACVQERDQLKIENARLNKNEDVTHGRTAIPRGFMGYIRRMGLNNT